MPSSWWDWLGIVASLLTIVSLILYWGEKHKRQNQNALMVGFLHGIRTMAEGMHQAGDEWRYEVDKNPPGSAQQYANVSVNNWKALLHKTEHMLSKLDPTKTFPGPS